jgi:hypothetical protein
MRSSGTTCRWSASPDDGAESAIEHWTEREIDKAAFKDARLGQRFGELLKQIGDGMAEAYRWHAKTGRARRRPTASSPTNAWRKLTSSAVTSPPHARATTIAGPHSGHDGILLPTCEYERHRPDQERQ